MQASDFEKRRIDISEQMQVIENELFRLSEGSGERDFESRRHFQRLCGERTQLADKLLLNILR